MKTLLATLTLVCLFTLAPDARAAQTPFAPVLLSSGETLVLSARVDETDWRPAQVAEGVSPCMLVGFEIVDLSGNVLARSQQPVPVEPGEAVTFEVSHADVAQGVEPCFLVGIVTTEPLATPVSRNGKVVPAFSLQVADASGVRIYAERGLAEAKPRKGVQRTSFAPVHLSPGESVNLAAFNEAAEKAGLVVPCMLVRFQLVGLDGAVLAETKAPHLVDPGEGASSSYSYEQLFGNGNLPRSIVALVEARPVERPRGRAGIVFPCMSLQIASVAGVEVYAAK